MELTFQVVSSSHGVKQTLPGHKGFVTTVKILKQSSESGLVLVSGDSLGEIRIWSSSDGGKVREHGTTRLYPRQRISTLVLLGRRILNRQYPPSVSLLRPDH